MREPAFTLTAGPVAASPRVLAALGSQIIYDYDPIFLERFRATQRKVAELFRTEGDVVLMQGEAVLGLEAAARGRRAPRAAPASTSSTASTRSGSATGCERLGATVIEHEVPYNDAVDPADVEALLDAHPEIERRLDRPLRDALGDDQPDRARSARSCARTAR